MLSYIGGKVVNVSNKLYSEKSANTIYFFLIWKCQQSLGDSEATTISYSGFLKSDFKSVFPKPLFLLFFTLNSRMSKKHV